MVCENLNLIKKNQRDISLKELKELAIKVLSEDWYPKELPNGMYEIAKGCFTNKKGLEKFYEVLNKKIENGLMLVE